MVATAKGRTADRPKSDFGPSGPVSGGPVVDERDHKAHLEGALIFSEEAPSRRHDDADRDDYEDDDGKAEDAMETLAAIVDRMGLEIRVTVREDDERIVLDMGGPDAGRAIGKKGQTLEALQFLVNKIVNRFPSSRRHIVVDSGDYRERHEKSLVNLAKREAKRAIEQGRTITLQPMPARDRRLVHLSLAKFPGVTTKSNGEGIGRRIQIIPARGGGGSSRRRR